MRCSGWQSVKQAIKILAERMCSATAFAAPVLTCGTATGALLPQELDIDRLRQLAASKGLGNHALRARAWPLLLGLPASDPASPTPDYDEFSTAAHRDSSVVKVDVDRSLHTFGRHLSDAQRKTKREALRRLLDAAVTCHGRESLSRVL